MVWILRFHQVSPSPGLLCLHGIKHDTQVKGTKVSVGRLTSDSDIDPVYNDPSFVDLVYLSSNKYPRPRKVCFTEPSLCSTLCKGPIAAQRRLSSPSALCHWTLEYICNDVPIPLSNLQHMLFMNLTNYKRHRVFVFSVWDGQSRWSGSNRRNSSWTK